MEPLARLRVHVLLQFHGQGPGPLRAHQGEVEVPTGEQAGGMGVMSERGRDRGSNVRDVWEVVTACTRWLEERQGECCCHTVIATESHMEIM